MPLKRGADKEQRKKYVYNLTIKKNQVVLCTRKGMELEDIVLRKTDPERQIWNFSHI